MGSGCSTSKEAVVKNVDAARDPSSVDYSTRCENNAGTVHLIYTRRGVDTVIYNSKKFQTDSDRVYNDPQTFCSVVRDTIARAYQEFSSSEVSSRFCARYTYRENSNDSVSRIYLVTNPLTESSTSYGKMARYLWRSQSVGNGTANAVDKNNDAMDYCSSIERVLANAVRLGVEF